LNQAEDGYTFHAVGCVSSQNGCSSKYYIKST
jgi:hypothetical protein